MSLLSTVVQRGAARIGLPAAVIAALPLGLMRFLGVGVVGLAVDLGLFTLLERLGLSMMAARAVSLPVATVVTWRLNRRHTFARTGRKAHHEALRYALVTLVAQSVNYLVMLGLAAAAHRLPHVFAAFAGSVAATLFSYTGQRFFTFSPASSPRAAPKA